MRTTAESFPAARVVDEMRPRLIPCLLLRNGGFVKTRQFRSPRYVGDPLVTVRLFNEKEADELVILDTMATPSGRGPDFGALQEIASECFMPVAYGGGVASLLKIERLFRLGIEKVVITTAAHRAPTLLAEAARRFGGQSIVAGIDVKRTWAGSYRAMIDAGRNSTGETPQALAVRYEDLGVGEILVQSIDRDGTKLGYDLGLIRRVVNAVTVPVIACGGAASLAHIAQVVREAGAAAAGAGSFFVFKGRHDAVLISVPSKEDVDLAFGRSTCLEGG